MNTPPVIRNPALTGFVSLDGTASHGIEDLFEGDPASRLRGVPTSVRARYEHAALALPDTVGPMHAYANWLPYLRFPSLNEGGTPMTDAPALAGSLGVRSLQVKREASNPTGSHKDRMTPLALARAIEVGAPGVMCASSGNAAISLAAYAAAASMPCRIMVTPDIADGYRRLLERMGAELIVCASYAARWEAMRRMVAQHWYPVTNYTLPAVGSNPFGVQGYKTIAFEIWQQLGQVDAVVVPCARGDLIWGIFEGYRHMQQAGIIAAMPALHAAEPFPRIAKVLAGHATTTDFFAGATIQFSIAGDTVTDQSVRAVRDSGGSAVYVSDHEARLAQASAARSGIDLEISACGALAAVAQLKAGGQLTAASSVVVIGTANSAREPAASLPPLLPSFG